jgi:WD40 repeat protein
LWTREIAFGGSVGGGYGDNGDAVFYPGETYERKFQPPIIMNGRLYYNERLGSSLWDSFVCVDLNTGDTIWQKMASDKNTQPITFGQLLDFQSPNQHGVIPYLWGVYGTTYAMYDAFSGSWILNITSVPSGSMVFGKGGEILIYSLSAATNRMTLWNSTRAINPTIDTTWSWRPTSTSASVTAGYMWNVSIPDVAGSQSITKLTPELIYARATLVSSPAAQVCDVAYDIHNGQEPVQLWVTNRTYEGTLMNGPLQVWSTPTNYGTYTYEGVFVTFVKETMVWYGYNAYTGAQIWGPTEPYESAWGMYQPYADSSLDGTQFYAGGYDGTVHAFNFKTGENVWNYYTGTSGFETPYRTYPFKDNALTTADGKVFAATNEHSPNTPYFHGWRLHAIDAATGQPVWNVSYIGLAPIIADGKAVALNYFDNRIYCFSTGPSETTVTAAPKIVEQGSNILIEGTVTDQSPGAKDTPAIADDSMSAWMEYVYEQHEIPATATGVPVKLEAIDQNGVSTDLGTVTTDISGAFSLMWKPTVEGKYTIVATFEGTKSYGSSYAQTSFGVELAKAAPTAPTTEAPTVAPTTAAPTQTTSPTAAPASVEGPSAVLYVSVAAVVVIVVLAAVAVLLRRRK